MSEIIGCRREQICRWFMMEKPQLIMRKGFDKRLATVLQVDRHTLFTGYLNIKPESTPTTEQPSHSQPSDAARRRVLAIVELMSNDGLKELARVGEILLRSGNVMQIA